MNDTKVRNAFLIGFLCSISYLAVYFARNILGTVTPQMIESGYSAEYIGRVSSAYFIFYAVGQLVNGMIGDHIKARNMISAGLLLSGITNVLFAGYAGTHPTAALFIYGMTGFFLAMIYGPMSKVVAENTEPVYATRCGLGYTLASFLGSPLAGITASFFVWQKVFYTSSIALVVMAVFCFTFFLLFEKKGIVQYNQYERKKEEGSGIRVLIRHRIIHFTLISIITGVIRTTVVFWMPTYLTQYLGFAPEDSALIFTVATFIISMTIVVVIFLYEKMGRDMDLVIFIMFLSSSAFFGLLYVVNHPVLNIVCLTLAIMSSNGASVMMWNRYCPSLRDTGMVSSVTGYLDFVSYIAAAVSSTLFADAVSAIGWGNLILVWLLLMIFGVFISVPKRKS